jgi:hypothetical protein
VRCRGSRTESSFDCNPTDSHWPVPTDFLPTGDSESVISAIVPGGSQPWRRPEIYRAPGCKQCGATLEHEALVTYNDNCPLCRVSYEAGKPYVFVVDASKVHHWICRNCEGSPRGEFHRRFEQSREGPKAAPPCCLCGAPSKLLAFTHVNPDGELLCEACSLSEAGKRMLKEHDEPER